MIYLFIYSMLGFSDRKTNIDLIKFNSDNDFFRRMLFAFGFLTKWASFFTSSDKIQSRRKYHF